MKLFYEADVLNGMQARNADGEATPFSRLLGQASAAEPGLIAFQATHNSKAVAGRVGFSPFLGWNLVFRATPGNSPMRVIRKSLRRLSCRRSLSAWPVCAERRYAGRI